MWIGGPFRVAGFRVCCEFLFSQYEFSPEASNVNPATAQICAKGFDANPILDLDFAGNACSYFTATHYAASGFFYDSEFRDNSWIEGYSLGLYALYPELRSPRFRKLNLV